MKDKFRVPKCAFLFAPENDWLSKYLKSDSFRDVIGADIDIYYDPSLIRGYDVVFILGYTKILDSHFLSENCLNLVVHESPLPVGKGFSPVQWQVLQGLNEITVTLLEAALEVDSGDIILQRKLSFDGGELYDEIRNKQAACTRELIRDFLNIYPHFNRTEQHGTGSVFPRRTPADSELVIDKSLREQFNLLRIANNEEWPAFFEYKGCTYIIKIYKATG